MSHTMTGHEAKFIVDLLIVLVHTDMYLEKSQHTVRSTRWISDDSRSVLSRNVFRPERFGLDPYESGSTRFS